MLLPGHMWFKCSSVMRPSPVSSSFSKTCSSLSMYWALQRRSLGTCWIARQTQHVNSPKQSGYDSLIAWYLWSMQPAQFSPLNFPFHQIVSAEKCSAIVKKNSHFQGAFFCKRSSTWCSASFWAASRVSSLSRGRCSQRISEHQTAPRILAVEQPGATWQRHHAILTRSQTFDFEGANLIHVAHAYTILHHVSGNIRQRNSVIFSPHFRRVHTIHVSAKGQWHAMTKSEVSRGMTRVLIMGYLVLATTERQLAATSSCLAS